MSSINLDPDPEDNARIREQRDINVCIFTEPVCVCVCTWVCVHTCV